jgi:hypothetical protein
MVGKSRARWGDGRIEVAAKWPEINTALAQSWPLTRIYEQYIDQTRIGYSQFRRQVQNRLESERTGKTPRYAAFPASPADAVKPKRKPVGTTHVRHDHARRTFDFDPADKDTDRDKLIGPGAGRAGPRSG